MNNEITAFFLIQKVVISLVCARKGGFINVVFQTALINS